MRVHFLIRLLSLFLLHAVINSFVFHLIKNNLFPPFAYFAGGGFFRNRRFRKIERQSPQSRISPYTEFHPIPIPRKILSNERPTATDSNNRQQQKRVVQMELKGFCNSTPRPGQQLQSQSILAGGKGFWFQNTRWVINIHFM